ncbi:actin beta/gamma 1 [Sarotherodon galilaeus]
MQRLSFGNARSNGEVRFRMGPVLQLEKRANRHADPPGFGVDQKESGTTGLQFEPEISKGDFFFFFFKNHFNIIRILREQVESLNATKNELGVDDDTLQQWVADVQKWAEETDQTDGSLGALQARIEELVVIIRVRTQSLYRQNDSNKRRHRIRKVILDEKKRLAAAVDDYNKLAEPTKQIVSSDALMQTDIWLWQSTSEPAADLQTKRKVFEKVMAVRRLREEEMILCREMWHHWTVLRMRSVVLGTISSDSSLVGMSEDAQKGLCSLV